MAEEKAKEEKTGGKKSSILKLIIIGVAVLVLVGAGFVGWKLLTTAPDQSTEEATASADQNAETEDALSKNYALDTFVVNLNDPGGKRYLKTNIELEYLPEAVGTELAHRLPQIRDLILLLLSSKSLEDIQTVDGKIALRRELIQRINQVLTSGKIRNLYFTQFVIQ